MQEPKPSRRRTELARQRYVVALETRCPRMHALRKPEQAWGAALGTPRRAPPPPAVLRPGFPGAHTHASRPPPSYAFFPAIDRPLLRLATPWTRCSEHPRACAPACPRPSPSAKPWHARAWLCPDHQTVVPHWYTRRIPRMRTPCQPEGRALWLTPCIRRKRTHALALEAGPLPFLAAKSSTSPCTFPKIGRAHV